MSLTDQSIPGATYRLQLHRGFGFLEARSLLPYLRELGITDLYVSPLFQARRGSLHGYSVTNPLQFNPELGSKAAFDHLVHKLKLHGMGLLLDIVPNHMATSPANPWWMDVLENGSGSPYATFFDIDWRPPPKRTLQGRVLLPVLGKPFGQALEDQDLHLGLTEDGFKLHYYEHRFPLDPKTYGSILSLRLASLEKELGEGHPAFLAMTGLITIIEHLPPRTVASPTKLKERLRKAKELKKSLWLLYQGSPGIKDFLDANLQIFNGTPGDPESFVPLDTLLAQQPYRLSYWRVSLEIINYRRFFSVNELIGIRPEDPQVFEATHSLLIRLVQENKVSGLRVDHIDGLYDPLGYLTRLQGKIAPKDPRGQNAAGLPIYVEKILAQGEPLPQDWPVCGTTGYDYLNLANGVAISGPGYRKLRSLCGQLQSITQDFKDLVYDRKKFIMDTLFGGEIESLGHQLSVLAEQDRYAQEVSLRDLEQSLIEVTACLPIYRTYLREYEVPTRECRYLSGTIEEAMRRNPNPGALAYDFLRRVLLQVFPPSLPEAKKAAWLRFVRRWQQFTGAIMAKGLEDTALYIYNCLVSLNEVGTDCEPVAVAEFHEAIRQRREEWPFAMNATSTHDTKRSEDVRARISVLSEIPEEWELCLIRWRQWNREKKALVNGSPVPDTNEEILLYQTMLGAWPLTEEELPPFEERLRAYVIKAAREAKVHTRWIAPNEDYEHGLLRFVEAILVPAADNIFLSDFRKFQEKIAYHGALNSLAQVLLKIGSPGVPDFYQGTELWDFSLVDPDNRRPVNFQKRTLFLKDLKKRAAKGLKPLAQQLLSRWQDGRLKLFLTYQALNFRQAHLDLFLHGEYLPLEVAGPQQEMALALARRQGPEWGLVIVPRLTTRNAYPGLSPLGARAWGETLLQLPPEAPAIWKNVLTADLLETTRQDQAQALPLKEILRHFPVALLAGASA